MSAEFIKERFGSSGIIDAIKQQRQINYFTVSDLQGEVTEESLRNWIDKKYRTDDHFLNFVKSIFRTHNFLSFYKYYRFPNASSKLIQNRILNPLKRVFYSDDAYSKYLVRGKEVESPEVLDESFKKTLFENFLFNHNAVLVHDLSDVNKPFREFVEIDKISSIESKKGKILRIAYTAEIVLDGQTITGYAYIDDASYKFYDKKYEEVSSFPHDLGYCPAFYVSDKAFSSKDVVRHSFFGYVREELEEYVFLKTLQRMTEPNGAIPVTAQLNVKIKDSDASGDNMPMSASKISGQRPKVEQDFDQVNALSQAGTITKVPVNKKTDGSIDTGLVENIMKFHYMPVENLKYLDQRIKDVEQNIIISCLGDYSEANESAKNELQVSKSYVSKEDVLRGISDSLSQLLSQSDTTMLRLSNGGEDTVAEVYLGSDFFLQDESKLYQLFNEASNPIERKNLLIRMTKTRNKHNKNKALRETILYKIMPYVSDKEFDRAKEVVSPEVFQLQTRFVYWISLFEATYGDIVVFWEDSEASESEKIIMITQLIFDLINKNTSDEYKENRTTASV